ncbi:MAG: O-antigen ligase family protein [Akkermansiaceae bacterium]|nr:O-antigen ligase family protein [Akkermansiaceae bacterium]
MFWLVVLAILVFGLMATLSRGAMLAGGAGLGVLVFFLRKAMWPALVAATIAVLAFLAVLQGSEAAAGIVERGSTGRLEIYRWFLERVTMPEALVGKGMATAVTISEEEFDWFVHHPHSSYLAQFLLTGVIGLAMMLAVIGWAGRETLAQARHREVLWLALLVGGSVAVLFDCAQVFSIYSAPRIELLLIAVPAALVMGRAGGER